MSIRLKKRDLVGISGIHSHQNNDQGGLLDHGLAHVASSLLDNDHPQYLLRNNPGGEQAIVGDLSLTSDINLSGSLTISTLDSGTTNSVIIEDSGLFEKRTISPRVWDDSLSALIGGTGVAGFISYWLDSDTLLDTKKLFYDTINERIGINTENPNTILSVSGDVSITGNQTGQRKLDVHVGDNETVAVSVSNATKEVIRLRTDSVYNGMFQTYLSNGVSVSNQLTSHPTHYSFFGMYHNVGINTITPNCRFSISGDLGVTGDSLLNGKLGIGEDSPVSVMEITHTSPYITLHNSTFSDADLGRRTEIISRGHQSGGEESVLSIIESTHDGSSDDEKGQILFYTNDGSDGTSPTLAMTIAGNQYIGIGQPTPSVALDILGNAIQLKNTGGDAAFIMDAALLSNANTKFRCNATAVWNVGMNSDNGNAYTISQNNNFASNEYIVVTTGGNVGINNDAPERLLHLFGGDSEGTSDDDSVLFIENNTNCILHAISPDADYSSIAFGSPAAAIGAKIQWGYDDDVMVIGSATASGNVQINSGNSALAMYINTRQDIGIGGNTPTSPITIFQPRDESALMMFGFDDKASSSAQLSIDASGNTRLRSTGDLFLFNTSTKAGVIGCSLYLYNHSFGSAQGKWSIPAAGDMAIENCVLAIGHASPSYLLDALMVKSNNSPGIHIRDNLGEVNLYPKADTSYTAIGGTRSGLIVDGTGTLSNYQLLCTTGGDVGIGSNTIPTANNGKVLFMGDNTADPTMGTNTAGFYGKDVGGTVEAFAIDEAGNGAQLTPHDEEGDWVSRTFSRKKDKRIWTEFKMVKLMKKLIELLEDKGEDVSGYLKEWEEDMNNPTQTVKNKNNITNI